MVVEQTLMLVKPDGVKAGHIGDVLQRLERKGYRILGLKVIQRASDQQLQAHYADKINEPFFAGLIDYMQSGPIVAIIVAGENVVDGVRMLTGTTKPDEAMPGSIRGDFGKSSADGAIRNVVHSSDSIAAGQREIAIWFPELSE